MEQKTGRLTEISSWGTGFIEDGAGAFFGFHYSMLKHAQQPAEANWHETLEFKPVSFQVKEGVVTEVILQAPDMLAAAAGHTRMAKASS